MQIQNNLQMIRQQIEQCCTDAKRDKSAVKLLAVSKTKSAQEVFVAYQAGQTAFGENYVQASVPRMAFYRPVTIQ